MSRVLHVGRWTPWSQPGAGGGSERALEDMVAALLHELRTPLAALSAEIEIALRRDRSPAAYREALTRMADLSGELIELTREFAVLTDPSGPRMMAASVTDLQRVLAGLASRYEPEQAAIELPDRPTAVVGDEPMLARALRVIVDQAVQSRTTASIVRLRTDPFPADPGGDVVMLTIETADAGLWPWSLQALVDAGPWGGAAADAPGGIRLLIAAATVCVAGGRITVSEEGGDARGVRLRITLRRAAAGSQG